MKHEASHSWAGRKERVGVRHEKVRDSAARKRKGNAARLRLANIYSVTAMPGWVTFFFRNTWPWVQGHRKQIAAVLSQKIGEKSKGFEDICKTQREWETMEFKLDKEESKDRKA